MSGDKSESYSPQTNQYSFQACIVKYCTGSTYVNYPWLVHTFALLYYNLQMLQIASESRHPDPVWHLPGDWAQCPQGRAQILDTEHAAMTFSWQSLYFVQNVILCP